jgi:hypothetical protein
MRNLPLAAVDILRKHLPDSAAELRPA